ncbi:MAG TPA: DUF1707 domain-containing protein [Verrucomicrobiae bacterium]|nr:DUF1707 domain-containing protein [Verrucomicrobiae bacterium]
MSTQPPGAVGGRATVLVADVDRERAVDRLRESCAQGRLTFGELADRSGAAYAARSYAELAAVLEGLPADPEPVAVFAGAGHASRRRAVHLTLAVMSRVSRQGRWRVHAHSVVAAVMGECVLDLRQATIDAPEVVVDVLALMGGVDIVVPEGVDVDLQGLAIMGGKQLHLAPVPVRPGTPLVRVRALALMGEVRVRSQQPAGSGREHPQAAAAASRSWAGEATPWHQVRAWRHQQRWRGGGDEET